MATTSNSRPQGGTATSAIDAVSNGLQGLTSVLGQMTNTLVAVRKEQVINARAEKIRNEALAKEIGKIWNDNLRGIAAASRKFSRDLNIGGDEVANHANAVKKDAQQILKTIETHKLADNAIKQTTDQRKQEVTASKKTFSELTKFTSNIAAIQQQYTSKIKTAQDELTALATTVAAGAADQATIDKLQQAKAEYDKLNQRLATVNAAYVVYDKNLSKQTAAIVANAKQITQEIETRQKQATAADAALKKEEANRVIASKSFGELTKSINSYKQAQLKAEAAFLKTEQKLSDAAAKVTANAADPAAKTRMERLAKVHDANRAKLETVNDTLNEHQVQLKKHGSIVGDVTEKLKQFGTAAAFGAATRKLYDEAQAAKTTGNYASMSEFFGGQARALTMGMSSAAYNKLNADTRTASMTAGSSGEFMGQLKGGGDILASISASKEEANQLTGQIMQANATAGISSKATSGEMEKLRDNFSLLSKVTGKSTAELVQLTAAIATDTDYRMSMLGLQDDEKARYITKTAQERTELVLQGYSIEQATELQKIAMQARTQSIQERVGKTAKATQSSYIVASMLGGAEGTKLRELAAQNAALVSAQNQAQSVQAREALAAAKTRNEAEQLRVIKEGKNARDLTMVQESLLNQFEQQLAASTGIQDAQLRTGEPKSARMEQARAEVTAGQELGKNTVMEFLTSAGGIITALGTNTLATVALTAVMLLTTGRLGSKVAQLAGLAGGVKTLATTGIAAIKSGGAAAVGLVTKGAAALGATKIGGAVAGIAGAGGAAASKGAARFIPGVGLVYGAYEAFNRAKTGDYTGAAIAGASGVASVLPGFGTAAAVGLQGAQMARDKLRTGSYLPDSAQITAAANAQSPSSRLATPATLTSTTTTNTPARTPSSSESTPTVSQQAATASPSASQDLTELARQFYTTALKYLEKTDPENDAKTRAQTTQLLRQLRASQSMNGAVSNYG